MDLQGDSRDMATQELSASRADAGNKPRYSPTTRARTRTKIARLLTSPFRVLPDFIVIGAQRSGTTSLFEYLIQHPQIVTPLYKEVRYFTDRYWLGPLYYRACFPTRWEMNRMRQSGPALTFDATPNYMFDPVAQERIKRKLPNVKLVAILRDPIDRAISQYRFSVQSNREPLPFEQAIAAEPERLKRLPGESDAQYYNRKAIRVYSYTTRGHYASQLKNVIKLFGRERLHVMCFESLIEDPQTHFTALLRFLGLEPCDGIRFQAHHQSRKAPRPDIAPETLQQLREHFAPHNAELREMFGDMFPWARE
jgi:hypothetical protein